MCFFRIYSRSASTIWFVTYATCVPPTLVRTQLTNEVCWKPSADSSSPTLKNGVSSNTISASSGLNILM